MNESTRGQAPTLSLAGIRVLDLSRALVLDDEAIARLRANGVI